jgi:hypothetical protein
LNSAWPTSKDRRNINSAVDVKLGEKNLMRKIMCVLLSAALVIMLAACAKSREAPEESSAAPLAQDRADATEADVASSSEKRISEDASDAALAESVTVDQLSSTAATYVDKERKFVRTADAQFRVKDVYQSAMAVENIVATQGGFVVSNQIKAEIDNVNRYSIGNAKLLELAEFTVRGTLSVRVPSDKTQDFLRALITQVEFLDQRNFQANDVQFDLLRKQLEFLRNQDAQKQLGNLVTEPGRIGDKAQIISGQNDAKAGRDEAAVLQKEIEDKVAFSTISLSLYQLSKVRKTEIDDVDAIAKNSRPSFFSRLFSALSVGWYGLLDIVVALFAIWPLWLVIGLIVYAIKRFRKK